MGGLPLTSHLRKIVDLVVLFTIFAINHQSDANIYEVAIFTDPNSNGFNHLTVHNVTGDVYIGGVNQLYRLDENLNLIINVTTGPEYDNYGVGHDSNNKILTFNYDYGDLITCGGYLGVCQKRHMQNLTVTYANQNLIYVVANITDDSTVGYVAHHYHFRQPMLYVGTTSTSSNLGYPFVSGRQLKDNIFEVLEDGRGNTRVDIDINLRTTFPVRYVAGFSYNGYSYFVTTQKSSTDTSSDYISKLVRVCQRSEQQYFNSYTEVTLRCRDDSYNLAQAAYLTRPAQDLSQSLTLNDGEKVLFVAFAEGVNDPPTPKAKSAICMYKMSVIETAFQDAAKGCMEGDGLPGYTASWMRGATCAGTLPFSRGTHECHALTHYQYANGVDDQHGYDVEDYTDTLVTSIAVTTVQQHTVGFLGIDTGHVLKIHFISDTNANTYERIEFTDTAAVVLPDMKFDLDNKHFYKTTGASVHKVRVEDCSQYLTCEDCFGSNDPYCGWCTLEKRCSTKANCTRSTGTSRWLHLFDANMCVEIEAIDPENGAPIDVANQITLNMIELPEEDSSNTYLCNYDGLFITSADKYGNNLTCDTPPIESRPKLPPGEDYTTIQLYVRSSETEDFVHTDFHFYDCNVHTSCSSCVSSKWNCNWCVYENRCAHYLDTRDDSMSIVVGENVSHILISVAHLQFLSMCATSV
ncbi:plexin-B-like [Ptychodera flava]|uniref:plexin-B-like n=1 Tax=Ptychodera flava TaxID=63121 RepID=UPI00396AA334